MTPRSLFIVILKIFGLLFLREIVYSIPQLISSFSFYIDPDKFNNNQFSNAGLALVLIAATILFYGSIIYLLLFKTNILINKFKLDKGFNQEEFSFNISSTLVLKICIIVLGGIILADQIPNFCRNVFSYYQENSLTHRMSKPSYSYIIISAVKIVIGFLIIGEREMILKLVQKKQIDNQGDLVDEELVN